MQQAREGGESEGGTETIDDRIEGVVGEPSRGGRRATGIDRGKRGLTFGGFCPLTGVLGRGGEQPKGDRANGRDDRPESQ